MTMISNIALPIKKAGSAAAVTLALMTALSAQVQAQDKALEDLKNCAQITDPAIRYACYDRMTGSLRDNPGSLPVLRATPASPAAADNTAMNGVTTPQVAAKPTTEFVDKVVAVKEREPGKLLVTLANGQTWYQVESRPYLLRPGMEVKLYPGIFGSTWRLSSIERSGSIPVTLVN